MASFEPFVSSDPFSMSTFNTKLGGHLGKLTNNALEVAQAAGMQVDTLWTNTNITGTFSNQYVTLSAAMTNYKFIAILAWAQSAKYPFLTFMVASGEKASADSSTILSSLAGISSGENTVYKRGVRVESDTSLYFDVGYFTNPGSSTSSQAALACIPFKVFGIK